MIQLQTLPWYSRRGNSGLSPVMMLSGALGLLLIAIGAILPEMVGTWAFSILLLPSGTLLCAGVAFLTRERELSSGVYLGLGLVLLGLLALNILAVQTANPFLGLRNASQQRAFRLPLWSELLELHIEWTLTSLVCTLGLHMICRRSLERDLAVGLALFSVFPLIGVLVYLIDLLPF